jgi:frataxin-like iron-binding protein CyaY
MELKKVKSYLKWLDPQIADSVFTLKRKNADKIVLNKEVPEFYPITSP